MKRKLANRREEYRELDVDEIARKYIEGNPRIAEAAVLPDDEAGGGS